MSKMEAKQFYVMHSLNKKMTLRQIINMSWKQSDGKDVLCIEEKMKLILDFSLETMQVKRQWRIIFKGLKKEPVNLQLYN